MNKHVSTTIPPTVHRHDPLGRFLDTAGRLQLFWDE